MPKAKTTRLPKSRTSAATKRPPAPQTPTRDPLVAAAATVGTTLGHLAGRVQTWDQQRAELIAEVQRLVAEGQEILKRLGHNGDAASHAETEPRTQPHVMPPDPAASAHRVNPTAAHDASVLAKAQHASERARSRATFRGQNR